jgi:hypothetical protein
MFCPNGARRRWPSDAKALAASVAAALVALASVTMASPPRALASRLPQALTLLRRYDAGLAGQDPFGPDVYIFTPSMPLSVIQSTVDALAAQQVGNQFGSSRYAVLFAPGTYGTPSQPLSFQVGYYEEVAGLGTTPGAVTVNGSIDVYNQCFGTNNCSALTTFGDRFRT